MRNKKAGLARRVRTRLARFPFCDGKVTILAGPSFLRINTLARILDPSAPHGVEIAPSRVNLVTWLRRDNQSMRTCCFTQSRQVRVLLGRATEVVKFFSHIDARSSWLGWGRGGGGKTLLPGTGILHIKGALTCMQPKKLLHWKSFISTAFNRY